jgi:hypothetical protein
MNQRVSVLLTLGAGFLLGTGTTMLVRPGAVAPPPAASAHAVQAPDIDDDDALASANANLVTALQDCNRRLAAGGQKPTPLPVAAPTASVDFGSRQRRPLTKEGWARLAEKGAVAYRIPCLRDPPFSPSPKQLEHLDLAAPEAETIREIYAKSNERVMAQLKPLCAGLGGNDQGATMEGAAACIEALIDKAGKEPDKMHQALVRVAEVQAGKRAAPSGALEPIETLMLTLANETSAFENELATRFGPEEAIRIAATKVLCLERRTVQAPKGSE